MKRTVLFIWLVCLVFAATHAQPMSGGYTVGGTLPDFATLQDCAIALKQRGVTGPVFLNIRPGTYTRNGGNNSVLKLDTVVAGVSATNRITFQPDEGAGGNVDNVVLQINRTNPTTADRDLIVIGIDFVTLRNLTIQDIDSSHTLFNHLINLQQVQGNPAVDGFILEGCKLIGTTHQATAGHPLGTDVGIGSQGAISDLTTRGNIFVRLMRAISFLNVLSPTVFTVEDNTFLEGYSSASGSGNRIGAGIEIACTQAIVRRNIIDFTNTVNGGFRGIYVERARTASIEKNAVWGKSEIGMTVFDFTTTADSILVANNMITGGNYFLFTGASSAPSAMSSASRNTRIIHNTIVVPGGTVNPTCLRVTGQDCTVLNNIIINNSGVGFTVAYDLGNAQTQNLQSDYNVIYKNPNASGPLIVRDGVAYAGLTAFQDSTGLDAQSVSKEIEFLDIGSDLHLTDCQAQDSDLIGIPVPGIIEDFDGDVRSLTGPKRGADETAVRAVPMFGDVFRTAVPGFITDIAAGSFDNILGAEGLAVADFTNSQVRLYHNLPSTRSFTLSQIISPGIQPMQVKFFDLDTDGNLDLVVSGDTSLIRVYWGDGGGGFPSDTSIKIGFFNPPVNDEWPVVSLDTGSVSNFPALGSTPCVLVSAGLRTQPVANFLGYLLSNSDRSVLFGFAHRPSSGGVVIPDSIPGILRDLVGGDIDGNGDREVGAILASGVITDFVAFNDTNAQGGGGFLRFGAHYNYNFGSTSYMPTSSLIAGRFDTDSDLDFITTAASTHQIIFLRNQGGFNFTSEPISVNSGFGLAKLDYDNDGDLDFATVNRFLDDNGITVFLNDGLGNFRPELNCFSSLASGAPRGVLASDFDLDGRTDLAIASSFDSIFVLYNFGGGINTVHDDHMIPQEFRLEQNYPNPFNPATTIRYQLPAAGHVMLKVYNVLGQEIATLLDEERPAGSHVVPWNGQNSSGQLVSSGVYFYRVEVKQFGGRSPFAGVKKMVLIR